MRHNRSLVVLVERRISDIRQTVRQTVEKNVDTQFLRNVWIEQLNILFSSAASLATDGVKPKQSGDKPETIAPKERQMWAHVAAHVGEVMGNLAKGFDERKFNEDLTELEKLVDEIKSLQDQTIKAANRAAEEKPADKRVEPGSNKVTDS